MALPTYLPYPAIANPIALRAVAALAGAGAWDAAPTEIAIPSLRWLLLFLSYTRGGAAGAFDFMIETSPFAANAGAGIASWFQSSLYVNGVLAAGADVQGRIQREYITYQAVGATQEAFTYGPIELTGALERLRVTARESGLVGFPGVLAVTGVFYSM